MTKRLNRTMKKSSNSKNNQPPLQEINAPWRNTPLDNWSTEIDPAIMSGDQWVDEKDPGWQRRENQALAKGDTSFLLAPFMHPTHDATYGNDEGNE